MLPLSQNRQRRRSPNPTAKTDSCNALNSTTTGHDRYHRLYTFYCIFLLYTISSYLSCFGPSFNHRRFIYMSTYDSLLLSVLFCVLYNPYPNPILFIMIYNPALRTSLVLSLLFKSAFP